MTEENKELAMEEIEQKTDTKVENKETGENVATNKPTSKAAKANKQPSTKKPTKKKSTENNPIRGLPKSGRPWKTPKQKFTTIKKTTKRLSFEKKQELRNELRHVKELSKEIKEQRKEAAVQKNQRRVENAERRLANERRAEVVQIIKNPSKLKRLKKKQMRMIEKRDVSQVKAV
ncbi:PREDICTED: coiled-coil domain-containing protein 86 [Bactrocera latifrons]|uniref:coiled-coil domain-containing protein 86 n=1 Tax=Bactrocera latifrons TaxID=174628 RepID=UPI0008DE563B|nr:PREDICTED: coiled-coil domain-containing protein 86 [Bactrocera latifrons]